MGHLSGELISISFCSKLLYTLFDGIYYWTAVGPGLESDVSSIVSRRNSRFIKTNDTLLLLIPTALKTDSRLMAI